MDRLGLLLMGVFPPAAESVAEPEEEDLLAAPREIADRFLAMHPTPTREEIALLIAEASSQGAIAASMAPVIAPNFTEHQRISSLNQDPEDYVVMETDAQIQGLVIGTVKVPNTGGKTMDAAIVTAVMIIPKAHLKVASVLGAAGAQQNPFEGAPNVLRARVLVRKDRLTDAGKIALGLTR